MTAQPELSRSVSKHLVRPGLLSRKGQEVPATSAELRHLADLIAGVLDRDPASKMMRHVTPHRLAEVDHLIGIHVMGYEFNESGKSDADGDSWEWRVSTATYTSNPIRPWTTSLESSLSLMRIACPALRITTRFGGKESGLVRKARFSTSHPFLAGQAVAIPDLSPAVRIWPAAGIACVALLAAATEREAIEARRD